MIVVANDGTQEEAVIMFGGALGDHVCVSGALNQYYKEKKKRLYMISNRPTLFLGQDYCKASIDINYIGANSSADHSNLFRQFKKIYSLFWQNENHLKGNTTLVENYCEQLGIKKVKYPFLKLKKEELNNFNITNKPYILVSFKGKEPEEIIFGRNKYLTYNQNLEIILKLKKDLPDYEIIDIADIQTNNFKDLILVVAKCKTFLSVDTALQHLAANDFQRKRGVVLWNNEANVDIYGYDYNINLVNNFVHPFDNYDIILKQLLNIL
tara:strand:+ start:381 stop:1181 length:801 start_codon:yes stop_codon:yes gene_type:complete